MHLGVIPDGNRRYASEQGIEDEEAYRQSKDVIIEILRNHKKLPEEVDEVTFYLLSEENLRRNPQELETVFGLLYEHMEEVMEKVNQGKTERQIAEELAEEEIGDVPELVEQAEENKFCFNWASTLPKEVPEDIRGKMRELEKRFSDGDKQLNALISYTGKNDIVKAARKLVEEDKTINQERLSKKLQVETDIDLVIRTGDNPRRECLSGFPIWQSSYAEYYHIEKHFPEVEVEDIVEAFDHYGKLRRKQGE